MVHLTLAKLVAPFFFLGINLHNCTLTDMVNNFGNPSSIEQVDNGYKFVFKRQEDILAVYTNSKSVPYEMEDTGLNPKIHFHQVKLNDSFKTLYLKRGAPLYQRFVEIKDNSAERFQYVYEDAVYTVAKVKGFYRVIRIAVPCNKAKLKGAA